LPQDFYKRVLDLERQVDTLKEKCPEELFKELSDLFRDAIEYFGFLDDQE
jgi:thiaminase